MDLLSCDNAIYEEDKIESSHEGFENKCYGRVTSTATNKHEEKNHSYSKVNIMAFVIVFVLLLGTAGACVGFALQITTLKSEIASLKTISSTSLEEVGHQLNTSIDMLYQQLSQQNASINFAHQQLDEKVSQQNTSIDKLFRKLSQHNVSNNSTYNQLNTSINMIYQILCQEMIQGRTAATSCKDLYDSCDATSGYYWIGSAVRVYCNMSLTCGNVTGGWMRVANIDMTDTSQNCPSGLDLITSPRRLCDTTVNGCASSDFNVHGAQYSHICGRIIGYQRKGALGLLYQAGGIDRAYVYGVSLTHGQNPREHIWTFAGSSDESSRSPEYKCPCINTSINPPSPVPSYIGSDYFCDTAFSTVYYHVPNFQSVQINDPLWDGEGCGSNNTCCYDPQREVNPPWFVKTLSSPTSDNIEMRLCHHNNNHGGTLIEIVEFYVQ